VSAMTNINKRSPDTEPGLLLAVEPPTLAVYVIRATTKRSPGKDGGAGASDASFSKADPVDAKELRCASASGELRHALHYQL
jgi:hypothetical protein